LATDSFTRAFSASYGRDDVVAQPAADFVTFGSLGALVYSRTATALDTIGRVYGKSKLERALKHYSDRYRFSHPGPREFLSALQSVLGHEAVENLEAILFERASIDLAVVNVKSVERPDTPGMFDNRAVFTRRGELQFPVELELVFDDNSRERRHWNGVRSVHSEEHEGPKRLTAAIVDPSYRVRLDDNLLNNTVAAAPSGAPATSERLSYYAALLLSFFGP
jgi:hypothetical protein